MSVMDWLESLRGKKTEKPLAPKTKAHIRNALYLLYQWAWRWKLVDHNPIQLVRQSTRRLKIPRVLTPEQFRALLDKLNGPCRTMVLVAGCTGLRVCEIVGLKWGDIKWQNLAIDVKRSVVAGENMRQKPKPQKSPCHLIQGLPQLCSIGEERRTTPPSQIMFLPGIPARPVGREWSSRITSSQRRRWRKSARWAGTHFGILTVQA